MRIAQQHLIDARPQQVVQPRGPSLVFKVKCNSPRSLAQTEEVSGPWTQPPIPSPDPQSNFKPPTFREPRFTALGEFLLKGKSEKSALMYRSGAATNRLSASIDCILCGIEQTRINLF
jgi:hypothetical protein